MLIAISVYLWANSLSLSKTALANLNKYSILCLAISLSIYFTDLTEINFNQSFINLR